MPGVCFGDAHPGEYPQRYPDEAALVVARRVAQWWIGDQSWADKIIDAYLNPAAASAELAHNKRWEES